MRVVQGSARGAPGARDVKTRRAAVYYGRAGRWAWRVSWRGRAPSSLVEICDTEAPAAWVAPSTLLAGDELERVLRSVERSLCVWLELERRHGLELELARKLRSL